MMKNKNKTFFTSDHIYVYWMLLVRFAYASFCMVNHWYAVYYVK